VARRIGGERAAYILSRSRDDVSGVSQKVGASDNGTNCLGLRNCVGASGTPLAADARNTAVSDSRAWHLVMAVSIRSSSGWRSAPPTVAVRGRGLELIKLRRV